MKLTNLKLKTRPKQLLGSLPLYIALQITVVKCIIGLALERAYDGQGTLKPLNTFLVFLFIKEH